MAGTTQNEDRAREQARAWRHEYHAAVCETFEPWAHGTVVRTSRYPTYYDLNVVRVEDEPGMSAAELTAFAERALAGYGHRRLDFEQIEAAEQRHDELRSLGWKTTRLLWMHHEHPLPEAGPEIEVERVGYDEVDELRLAWHLEESDGSEYERYRIAAREVSMTRDVIVLAVREGGRPISFAQLELQGTGAEIGQVYVRPDRRGSGIGTAMTRAAILAAGEAEDLWIVADDDDRPKHLYERLGFRGVWTSMECLLLP